MSINGSLRISLEDVESALRGIHKSGYYGEGENGPLWDVLKISATNRTLIKLFLYCCITNYYNDNFDADILLMMFQLLPGYQTLNVGERYEKFVRESDFIKEKCDKNEKGGTTLYEKLQACKTEQEYSAVYQNAYESLRNPHARTLMTQLSKYITRLFNAKDYSHSEECIYAQIYVTMNKFPRKIEALFLPDSIPSEFAVSNGTFKTDNLSALSIYWAVKKDELIRELTAAAISVDGNIPLSKNRLYDLIRELQQLNQSDMTISTNPFRNLLKGHYVQRFNSDHMVDRVDYLPLLHETLQNAKLPIYLYADIGGIGKTTVASAYIDKKEYSKVFDYIFWVTVINDDIRVDIMNYSFFSFTTETDSPESDFRRFLGQAAGLDGTVLLVLDNITKLKQIQNIEGIVFPPRWKVLVTTRAILNDTLFKERVIPLKELECADCRDLFYTHYPHTDEEKAKNEEALNKILAHLDFHTYLIVLLAKVGEGGNYTIPELTAMLEEKGIQHTALQEVAIYDRDKKEARIFHAVESLFLFDSLTEDEEKILYCFSLLPDKPIPAEILCAWMAEMHQTISGISAMLRKLCEKGWLIQEKTEVNHKKVISYKCHNVIQTVLRSRQCLSKKDSEAFLRGFTQFFSINGYEDRLHLVPYYDCVANVLKNIPKSKSSHKLKLWFVRLLNRDDTSPKGYAYADELLEEYPKFFLRNDENSREWELGWVDICVLYSELHISNTQEEGKYSYALKIREDAFATVQKHLLDTDLQYLHIEHRLAVAKRMIGHVEEALEMQKSILKRVNNTLATTIVDERNDYLSEKRKVLISLGASYTALATILKQRGMKEDHYHCLLSSYDARKEAIMCANELCCEHSIIMASMYINLSHSLIQLSRASDEKEKLQEAEGYLKRAYEICLEKYGEHSLRAADTLSMRALFFDVQEKYGQALENAKQALEIRQNLLPDKKRRVLMLSYARISRISLSIWKQEKDEKMLFDAFKYCKEALEIATHLFGENPEHHEYKDKLLLKEEIDTEMKTLFS